MTNSMQFNELLCKKAHPQLGWSLKEKEVNKTNPNCQEEWDIFGFKSVNNCNSTKQYQKEPVINSLPIVKHEISTNIVDLQSKTRPWAKNVAEQSHLKSTLNVIYETTNQPDISISSGCDTGLIPENCIKICDKNSSAIISDILDSRVPNKK